MPNYKEPTDYPIDQQPDGTKVYLPKGIYMEATELPKLEGQGGTYHSYLVYRDGAGHAEVIRGGFDIKSGNMDLKLQIGIGLKDSLDAYYIDEKIHPFDHETHLYAVMVEAKDAEVVWKQMTANAKKIDPTINYNPKVGNAGNVAKNVFNLITDEQVSLAKNSVVCHSVTGTLLAKSGISIESAVAKMSAANPKLKPPITEDSFTGIRTDLFGDGLTRATLFDEVLKSAKQIHDIREEAKEIIKNTLQETKDRLKNLEKQVDKAKDDFIRSLLSVQEGIQELKKSIDSIDSLINDASNAKSSPSLEYLVKNEVGVEALTLAAAQQPCERLNISQKDYESLAKPDNDKQHVNDSISTHTATA
jgi:soluble cytochrome b562